MLMVFWVGLMLYGFGSIGYAVVSGQWDLVMRQALFVLIAIAGMVVHRQHAKLRKYNQESTDKVIKLTHDLETVQALVRRVERDAAAHRDENMDLRRQNNDLRQTIRLTAGTRVDPVDTAAQRAYNDVKRSPVVTGAPRATPRGASRVSMARPNPPSDPVISSHHHDNSGSGLLTGMALGMMLSDSEPSRPAPSVSCEPDRSSSNDYSDNRSSGYDSPSPSDSSGGNDGGGSGGCD